MTSLTLQNVSFVYGEKTPLENRALDNISFEIEANKITGLIGHTGSGKSTLVRLLNGLERPTSGKILLNGQDIWEKPKKIASVRYRVGIVMQYPEYQLFEETVEKDIAFGPKNMGLDAEEIDRRVKYYAEVVGLTEDDLQKSPFDLSGGQKRRAAIAGIMAMNPEVIVLDEPAAGLDPEGRQTIFDAIERYRQAMGATVLIVSHSMDDMAERCDNIAILNRGHLCAFGDCGKVFSNPQDLIDYGLDVPEVTRLSMLLGENGIDIGTQYTVKDAADALEKLLGRKSE